MVSIKQERFGGGRSGGGGVNPTAPEIYLFDQIDDIRDWIKKNKRSNLTGKQIKPIISKWISNLDKVYSSFNDDKTIPNAALMRGLLIQTKDYLSKIVNKQDSELTYEYLVKMGSPDRSRQAFWFGVDNLFAKLNEGLGIIKQGSLYKYKNSKSQGVLNGNIDKAEVEEPKRRWFGPARILGGAGSGKPLSPSQQHTRMPDTLPTPTAGSTAKPLFSGSSPTAPIPQPEPQGKPAPMFSPSPSSSGSSSSPQPPQDISDDKLSPKDFVWVEKGDEEAINAFEDICSRAIEYLKEVNEFSFSALRVMNKGVQYGNAIGSSIDAINKYIPQLGNDIQPMDKGSLMKLIDDITKCVRNGARSDVRRIISEIEYIEENTPIALFGIDLNSASDIEDMRIPDNNKNNNGGNQDIPKKDQRFTTAVEIALAFRRAIFSKRKIYESAGSNGKIESVIENSINVFIDSYNKFTSGENSYKDANLAFLQQSSASIFNSSLDSIGEEIKVIEGMNSQDYSSDEFKKSIGAITEKIKALRSANVDITGIDNQLKALSNYVSGNPAKWLEIGRMVAKGGEDITPGKLLSELSKKVAPNKSNSTRNIFEAYEEDSQTKMADIKSIQLVRSLAKQEMVKMFNEIESYWG